MKIHLLPYLLFALLSFATSESINAYGNGKQQQAKLAANYSKRIMTGGMFIPGRDSASNAIRRAIVDTSKNFHLITDTLDAGSTDKDTMKITD